MSPVAETDVLSRTAYDAVCAKCSHRFDACRARWCACDNRLRTLVCPKCRACFCHAPIPYKQNFWLNAPQSLRENPQRFRIEKKTPPTELVPIAPVEGSPRVLIVDDDESIRSYVASYVEQLGYDVATASGPEEALLLADEVQFNVVVSDALMPKMDGREMCRRLKISHGDRVKTVLMTSLYTASHYQTEARHVFRIDEYLRKPLDLGELKRALSYLAPIVH